MIINFIKHIILSLSTARQFSKKKGIKLFLNIFIIRFFFAFDLIRRLFENKDLDNDNKISSKYFEKDIFSYSILRDLMTKGVNFNLKLKEFFLGSIISDLSYKNVFINFKSGR